MQYTTTTILASAAFLSTVSAHGFITSPQARLAGDAMRAACGEQVYNNQASDNYGNIQGELQVAASQSDYDAAACNIWLCKGFKFDDNKANVQEWTAGQTVDFKFDLRAPHAGVANISIIDTATNSIIGIPLLSYSDFANNAYPTPENQTSLSITIPTDIGDKCSTAGACVIQHWWDAASINQSYESCIDFVVGDPGSGSPAPSSSASAPTASSSSAASSSLTSSAALTSTPIATSSSIPVPTTLVTIVSPSAAQATSTESTITPTPTPTPGDEHGDCEEEL